jgi:hypothetical protein
MHIKDRDSEAKGEKEEMPIKEIIITNNLIDQKTHFLHGLEMRLKFCGLCGKIQKIKNDRQFTINY